jgi:hypothetical protein
MFSLLSVFRWIISRLCKLLFKSAIVTLGRVFLREREYVHHHKPAIVVKAMPRLSIIVQGRHRAAEIMNCQWAPPDNLNFQSA